MVISLCAPDIEPFPKTKNLRARRSGRTTGGSTARCCAPQRPPLSSSRASTIHVVWGRRVKPIHASGLVKLWASPAVSTANRVRSLKITRARRSAALGWGCADRPGNPHPHQPIECRRLGHALEGVGAALFGDKEAGYLALHSRRDQHRAGARPAPVPAPRHWRRSVRLPQASLVCTIRHSAAPAVSAAEIGGRATAAGIGAGMTGVAAAGALPNAAIAAIPVEPTRSQNITVR
jgi:hypothetical protein